MSRFDDGRYAKLYWEKVAESEEFDALIPFSFVKNYNKSMGSAACSYFTTLIANDPTTSEDLTFQTSLGEKSFGKFELTSCVSRPQGTKEVIKSGDYALLDDFYIGCLPQWPLENAFDDTKRFYVVKKLELQDNDWIRLYLELAVATADRSTPNVCFFFCI
ncbi:unnamed protein product, partial [Arabidopsis halleri]